VCQNTVTLKETTNDKPERSTVFWLDVITIYFNEPKHVFLGFLQIVFFRLTAFWLDTAVQVFMVLLGLEVRECWDGSDVKSARLQLGSAGIYHKGLSQILHS